MAFPYLSTNYLGRTVDLSIFAGLAVSGVPVASGFTVASDSFGATQAVAGPSKAAQNYARVLLTPLGSNRARPLLGSNFLPKVRAGAVRYPADLASLFAIENLRVLTFLSTLPAPAFPDERVQTVTMTAAAVNPTGFAMSLSLTVASGDTLPFLLPVAWSVS